MGCGPGRTIQTGLLITPEGSPDITVDDLEVAQFIYLLLNNEKIRKVVDNISKKLVLILGRFSDERKPVLDFIREALREKDYLPVLIDFEKPDNRDLTETVGVLAHMARFVIADISSPRSVPQELERIVKDLPSVPIQPIICAGEREYGMVEHYKRYPWFLEVYSYKDLDHLRSSLNEFIVGPPEAYLSK